MACINITIEDRLLKVFENAIIKKMGEINSHALISGVMNKKMQDDYIACEDALNVILKAKESLVDQEKMRNK